MKRRDFIKFIGTFAAATAIPIDLTAKIAESRKFAGKAFTLFECSPLSKGKYTISWYCGEKYGLFVGGIDAVGGETIIKVWDSVYDECADPRISQKGIIVPACGSFNFTDAKEVERLVRGEAIGVLK